jgi:mannan endo-1,4-beta-mannosidase
MKKLMICFLLFIFCIEITETIAQPIQTSPPPVQPIVTRPTYNTGIGLFVKDGKVYDRTGREFIIRGVNLPFAWAEPNGTTLENNYVALDANDGRGIAFAGANAARLTCNWTGFPDHHTVSNSAQMEDVVKKLYKANVVPIMEIHYDLKAYHFDENYLKTMVDYWLLAENVAWMKRNEKELIINIVSEWGHNDEVWKENMKKAVRRFREQGVNCLLMIDAGGNYGQNPNSLIRFANEILEDDPQKNIIFSLHMYAFWISKDFLYSSQLGTWQDAENECSCTGCICPPWDIESEDILPKLQQMKIPIVIGELSSEYSGDVSYMTKTLLKFLLRKNIGFLAWSWNNNNDRRMDMLKRYRENGVEKYYENREGGHLTPFGLLITNDPEVGLRNTARPANH